MLPGGNMGKVLVGISSWSDASLIESGFYPKGVRTAAERLRYYAARFPVAEIDSSFHFLPSRHSLELWLESTPPGFVFDIKAFSLFTRHPTSFESLPGSLRGKLGDLPDKGTIYEHHLGPELVDELWRIFNGIVAEIDAAGKLGAVLFQFPPYFHPRPDSLEHISKCRQRLASYRMAVEFRAGGWLDDERRQPTLDFLKENGITLVCVDEPQGFPSSLPPLAAVTAPLGFVRFHGRNGASWERKGVAPEERFAYLYNEDELREWVPRIEAMARQAEELHIIFKNKHADYPVANARQLIGMLEHVDSVRLVNPMPVK